MKNPAVKIITDAIPVDMLCLRLGVSEHSIRHARTSGRFPASWYAPLKDICEDASLECPLDAFNWKSGVEAAE